MTALVNRLLLERMSTLDMMLSQRLTRRATERAVRLLARGSSQWGPRSAAIQESDSAYGACLGGLEVSYSFGSTLLTTRGAMAFTNNARATETRPGSWSGNVEPDDDDWTVYELATSANATPSGGGQQVPIAGALVQPEWWIVYGAIAGAGTVESDSNRRVFNELTGIFDPASASKIKGATFVPAVYRGVAGGTLAAASAAVSAITAAPPIAFVWVPAGATDLSAAQIFDCRRLTFEDRGPNRVEGTWSCPANGAVAAPFAGKTVFQGVVRARLGGEWLECRSSGLDLNQIVSPGQSWAAPGPPQIAWLYLAKVQGLVPRLRAVGAAPIGIASSGQVQSGILVLSQVPPRIRASGTGPLGKGAQRWDLRNSAAIALPTATIPGVGAMVFPYVGSTAPADDAICVGFMLYTATDAGSGFPMIFGPYYCQDGWISGNGVNAQETAISIPNPLATPTADQFMTVGVTLNSITVLGDVVTLPFDGVRASFYGTSSLWSPVTWNGPESGDTQYPTPNGGLFYIAHTGQARALYPGQSLFYTHAGVLSGGVVWNAASSRLLAVRMPYGEPLVT